jgi:hypothetical protein
MDTITERVRVLGQAVAEWTVAAGLRTRRLAVKVTALGSSDA